MKLQQAHSLRSQLFVPALSAQFVEKATSRGADAIIVDLEDAIAPAAKAEARAALAGVVGSIAARGTPVFVRVNNQADLLADDLAAALATPLAGIYLPKTEDPAQVRAVAERTRAAGVGLVLLLESPIAVLRAAELCACSEDVIGAVFGSEDYASTLGVLPTIESMQYPASAVALAARAHGRAAWGVVGSLAEFGDLALLGRMARSARHAGFTGALAIHPKQVPVLNEAFGASAEELDEAQAIVAAFEQAMASGNKGAIQHRGRMLDKPIVERAQRLLARAGA